jgi:hypothetical protein
MLYHLSYRPGEWLSFACHAMVFLAGWRSAASVSIPPEHGDGLPRVCAACACIAFRRSDIRMPQQFHHCQQTGAAPGERSGGF